MSSSRGGGWGRRRTSSGRRSIFFITREEGEYEWLWRSIRQRPRVIAMKKWESGKLVLSFPIFPYGAGVVPRRIPLNQSHLLIFQRFHVESVLSNESMWMSRPLPKLYFYTRVSLTFLRSEHHEGFVLNASDEMGNLEKRITIVANTCRIWTGSWTATVCYHGVLQVVVFVLLPKEVLFPVFALEEKDDELDFDFLELEDSLHWQRRSAVEDIFSERNPSRGRGGVSQN